MLADMLEPQPALRNNEFYMFRAFLIILDLVLTAKEAAEAVYNRKTPIPTYPS